MKWLRYLRVSIDAITAPPDIDERMASPHVRELADSFDSTGDEPMQCPAVQADSDGGYELVAGRDRYAACRLRNAPDLWVRVGQFTALERARAEVIENLRRRDDARAPLIARLVELTEQEGIKRQVSRNSTGPGRAATERGEARRQVARETGLSVASVARADQRQKAREVAAAPENQPPPGETAPPPPIETWGMPLSEAQRELVQPVLDALAAADRHMRAAQAALKDCGVMDGAVASRLHEDAHRLAANIRAAMPAALCPWCKWAVEVGGGYVTSCHGCRSLGWVTAEKLNVAPPELRAPDVYAVATAFYDLAGAKAAWSKVDRPVANAKAQPSPPPRGTKAKPRITIEVGGKRFDPYADEPPPASDADLPEPPDDDVPPMDDDDGLAF